tara:strand:- start:288 stop:752 length:465 start_codon:yes stop_codon:yes gene_type:complete
MAFWCKLKKKEKDEPSLIESNSANTKCYLSEKRIRDKLNLFKNSLTVYAVTCTNIYDTYTGFDDIVSLECVFWEEKDAQEMVSQININDPSVVDGGKSDLYYEVKAIDIGIKISGELYIVTKLKAKHRLIVLDKMLYFLDSDLKLDHYTIFNIE